MSGNLAAERQRSVLSYMRFYFLSTIRAPSPPPVGTCLGIHGEGGILADFRFAASDGGGYVRDVCENKEGRRRGSKKCPKETRDVGECSFGRSEESPEANNRRGVLRRQELRGLEAVLIINSRRMCVCLFTAAPPRDLAPAVHAYDRCIHVYLYVCTYNRVNITGGTKTSTGKRRKSRIFHATAIFLAFKSPRYTCTHETRKEELFNWNRRRRRRYIIYTTVVLFAF